MNARINQTPSCEPVDGCECLKKAQIDLLAIPAFCLEAADNADGTQRQKLHLYATTGDKAAYNALLETIVNEYADLQFTERRNRDYGCCEASTYLLNLWREVQAEEMQVAA